MRNIILCGFMGSGKTTIGKLLAKKLRLSFLDVDDYIAQKAQMSIPDIFSRCGEAHFRDLEHDALSVLGRKGGHVLATGGGALTFERNIPPARESGRVIYINPGFDECYRRIAASDRPLVRGHTKEQLEALYAERDPLYRAACHMEVCAAGPHAQWLDVIVMGLEHEGMTLE
jgi:shikimate kinase